MYGYVRMYVTRICEIKWRLHRCFHSSNNFCFVVFIILLDTQMHFFGMTKVADFNNLSKKVFFSAIFNFFFFFWIIQMITFLVLVTSVCNWHLIYDAFLKSEVKSTSDFRDFTGSHKNLGWNMSSKICQFYNVRILTGQIGSKFWLHHKLEINY